MGLRGSTVVVTGTSSGVGRGVALALAEHGAHVVLTSRRATELEAIAVEIRHRGGRAFAVPADVSDPDAVERVASRAVTVFGRIDVWIANAGVAALGPFWEVPIADHDRVVQVNVMGTMHCAHAALRQDLRVTRQSRLIRVGAILPWALDTPLWEHVGNRTGHAGRMAGMEDPQRVVDAVVAACARPRRSRRVGWKAHGAEDAARRAETTSSDRTSDRGGTS